MHKRFYEYQKMVILQSAKIGELTPLMEAVINPTVQLTDDLIATYAGMAMDGIHRYGRWNIFNPTALMLAAAYNNVDGVRKLIDTTEVRMQNAHGWTALMYASVNGHTECVKLLRDVEAGLQCLDGMTALIEAAQHGKTEVVQLLLEKEGVSPRMSALSTGAASRPSWLRVAQIIMMQQSCYMTAKKG